MTQLQQLDHAAFGRNRPNADNLIDSKNSERALREKPVSTFSQRALAAAHGPRHFPPHRFDAEARSALDAALAAGLEGYDRSSALARFPRLSAETIASETPQAARAALKEIERAMRSERARRGQWSYDLNRHIALLIAHRAETARLHRLLGRA